MKKHIYFLINSLEWGGAERVVANLSQDLIEQYDIDIICLKKSTPAYKIPEHVRIFSFSNIQYNILLFPYIPYFVWRLRNIFKENSYISGVSFLEISNFVHIFTRKDAMISFRTSIGFFQGIIGNIYKYLIKILYPQAGMIIVNSLENKYELAKYLKIEPEKIEVIYNPIDLDTIIKSTPIDISLLPGYDEQKSIFMTTGRLISSKHHATIITSLYKLSQSGTRDFLYYIIWSGPEETHLKVLTEKYGLEDSIFLLGQRSDIYSILQRADYFIYASEVEWFPNVLIEAVAVGVPVITSHFKTWAYEVMLAEYTWSEDHRFPVLTPNWVMLDHSHFQEQFIEIYTNLSTLRHEKKWLEKYTEGTKKIQALLTHTKVSW